MNEVHSDVLIVGAGYLGSCVASEISKKAAIQAGGLVRSQSSLAIRGNNQFAVPKQSRSSDPFEDSDGLITPFLGQPRYYATTRGTSRKRPLDRSASRAFRSDWERLQLDWTDGRTIQRLGLHNLSPGARVLIAISYDRSSRHSRYDSQVGGLVNLLSYLPKDARVCYISTTGVYHQKDGRWVDETSPTFPSRPGGQAHLQAEQQLHAMRPNSPWMVLRLAGIYGPGRVPRAADVIAGRPIASPQRGHLNLIHVQDAARAVIAAWDRMLQPLAASMQERLYLVSDNRPVVRGDFYRFIANHYQAPAPTYVQPAPGSPVMLRSDSDKRVSNRKLRRDLLPSLLYPDYRDGLVNVLT